MLTEQENERLTQVGPGTPMGNLLRRYWHPVATLPDIEREQVMGVRILGEDLVLYKTRKGEMGLIQQRCPHRSTAPPPSPTASRRKAACAANITAGSTAQRAAASSSRSRRWTTRTRTSRTGSASMPTRSRFQAVS